MHRPAKTRPRNRYFMPFGEFLLCGSYLLPARLPDEFFKREGFIYILFFTDSCCRVLRCPKQCLLLALDVGF